MSNILNKFGSTFPDLASGNTPLSVYPPQSQKAFIAWLLAMLNQYGDHLNHILDNPKKFEMAMEAWADGFRDYTPKHVVSTLQVFCDGKASISNRFECGMPRNIAEFAYEMRTNQHQGMSYETEPKGLALDYDRDTARTRDERGNRACLREAVKCLPSFGALIKQKEGRLAEIQAEGGERLDLHQKRKLFYDRQIQEQGHISNDYQ